LPPARRSKRLEPSSRSLAHDAARVAIGIVLLIVAVNVGTLVYARNAARWGKIAVRLAMGASRRRIAMQMFVESLLLGSLAAGIGVAILLWPPHMLRQVFSDAIAQSDGIPYRFEIRFDPSTALLVVCLVVLSAVLTGVLPALKLTDRHLQVRLQRVQEGTSGLRFGKAMTLIVVSQVALSVALMTVGGVQLRTFTEDWWSQGNDVASRRQYLTTALRWDHEAGGAGANQARGADLMRGATWRELGRRPRLETGVGGVTFESFQGVRFFAAEHGSAQAPSANARWTCLTAIEPNLFDAQRARLLAGRAFDTNDTTGDAPPALLVNEAFVQAMLPPGNPIGRRVRRIDPRTRQPVGDWLPIVGVVSDTPALEIAQRGPAWVARPTVYLLLSTTGVYAMMSFTVTQRTREIGIRTALGAPPKRIVGEVFSRAMRQLA
jgi:putative ABC transport system permease protein